MFKPGGEIHVGFGAALMAKGTRDKPIELVGSEKSGIIQGQNCTIVLERCRLTHMAGDWGNRRAFLAASAGNGGIALRQCTITDCAEAWLTADGPVDISGCELRRREGLFSGDAGMFRVTGKRGKVQIAENIVQRVSLDGSYCTAETLIRDNVVVDACVGNWAGAVENNYVHQTTLNGTYGLLRVKGVVRNNLVRGGSWTTAGLGGEIASNVFESEDRQAAAKRKLDGTHEHICGIEPGSRIVRNIFVCSSYGAIMTIGATSPKCLISNNTFDLNGSSPLYMNHLVKGDTPHHVARNNLFCARVRFWTRRALPTRSIAWTTIFGLKATRSAFARSPSPARRAVMTALAAMMFRLMATRHGRSPSATS